MTSKLFLILALALCAKLQYANGQLFEDFNLPKVVLSRLLRQSAAEQLSNEAVVAADADEVLLPEDVNEQLIDGGLFTRLRLQNEQLRQRNRNLLHKLDTVALLSRRVKLEEKAVIEKLVAQLLALGNVVDAALPQLQQQQPQQQPQLQQQQQQPQQQLLNSDCFEYRGFKALEDC